MTSPLRPGRRRAEEFARLLEGAPAGALAPVGTSDPVLAPLVGLAQALRSVPLGPSPDFRFDLGPARIGGVIGRSLVTIRPRCGIRWLSG